MLKLKFTYIFVILIQFTSIAQTQTVGVFINDTTKIFDGYTLFAPKLNTMTYLINNKGQIIHQWNSSQYAPGQSVFLLENGNLLRTCMTQGNLGTGGGEGGRIEEYNWNDSLIWFMNYSTSTYMQHHDIRKLPNGNIIMLVVEKKTASDCINAGFDTSKFQEPDFSQLHFILPDCIVEIQPTYPSGGIVVWEWHVWDHLIQDFDATKNNFGIVNEHPELIDCDGDHRNLPIFWNHMNSIDYNPLFDQIVMSVRGNSELWIIDHSTTTIQAASHSGGNSGKGGDILYRWGNPLTYGEGTVSNQKFFEQHDVEWIKPGFPGAGNLTCFNNGVNRDFSSVDEIIPPVDTYGNYSLTTGSPFLPTNLTWTYQATPPQSMFAHDISGASRLPNGNTIICVGPIGTFYEVTHLGEVVWKYISPVDNNGPIIQGSSIPENPVRPGELMNSVFRFNKYSTNYPAFIGKDLTPEGYIEITNIQENNMLPSIEVFPNPFHDKVKLKNQKGGEYFELFSLIGQQIWSGYEIEENDFSLLNPGVYLLKIHYNKSIQIIKLIKV